MRVARPPTRDPTTTLSCCIVRVLVDTAMCTVGELGRVRRPSARSNFDNLNHLLGSVRRLTAPKLQPHDRLSVVSSQFLRHST